LRCVLACAALFVSVTTFAAPPPDFAQAAALLEQYVADRKIAGAVAAVHQRGQLLFLKAVGRQDVEEGSAMTERSLFRIYSMTKAVTAVAAMILHDEGRFSLQEPVAKYLPQFQNVKVLNADGSTRPPSREITIADLFLHTSGLSHRTSDIYRQAHVRSRSIPLTTFIDNIVRVPLMEDPGMRFRYSEATTVLGRLIEIWSDTPLDAFLEQRIFKPLRMVDTGFWVRPDQRTRLTTVYAPAAAGGLRAIEIEEVPFTARPALLEGAVGLVSTVPDFLRFCRMLLNQGELEGTRILKAETVARMVANGLSDPIQEARGGSMGWGLASVNVLLDPAAPNRGEYGWDGTAGTIFWIHPARELITVLMTQSSPANPDSLRQRFKASVEQVISSSLRTP
jgi:CubicO group peptidase (beta-lactamase class C family)